MNNKIILGTVQFGLKYGINNVLDKPSENQVTKILDYASTQGLAILDTADAYGDATDLIGKYNIKNPNKYIINTKFKADGSSLVTQLNKSLNNLNVDDINIYFYHNYDDFINNTNLKDQLLDIKEEGKINKIGLSVYENHEFEEAIESDLIDVIQFPFNLLDNYSQRGKLISLAKKAGKELQVRSVFLQGLFFRSLTDLSPHLLPLKPYLKKIHEISDDEDISIEQLALNYVLQQHEIDNIIIGVDSIEQIEKNIKIADTIISDNIIEAINQIIVHEVELLYPKNWK